MFLALVCHGHALSLLCSALLLEEEWDATKNATAAAAALPTPSPPCWQLLLLLSLRSLPHSGRFCFFSLFGEDLFHLPSKPVPIFLLTSQEGGADTDPVQNEIVDVWLPWGAGAGGSGMFSY